MAKLLQELFDGFQNWLCTLGSQACMDGHGGYVWLSYGLTLTVLIVSIWVPVRAHRLWLVGEAQRITRQKQFEDNAQ